MRVVDGVHRMRAATVDGASSIRAVLVDGEERDLFVLAVRLNAGNGLPLSIADRRAAAERVIGSHAHWSDRMIADLTGLSARIVADLRVRSTAGSPQSNRRLGRDGKVRPLDVTAGRNLAARLITDHPEVSLRAIASRAGISLGTAQDVRRRMRAGEDPVPDGRRGDGAPAFAGEKPTPASAEGDDPAQLLERLRADPSLRFSAGGRTVLRLLDAHALSAPLRARLLTCVPIHCASTVAALARRRAESWLRFADEVESASSGLCDT